MLIGGEKVDRDTSTGTSNIPILPICRAERQNRLPVQTNQGWRDNLQE